MSFRVHLTNDVARDVEEICDYIDRHEAPGRADCVLNQIEKVLQNLSEHPRRGNYPKELLDLGIREYREIFFRPYRIIYRVIESNVCVLVSLMDGVTCSRCCSGACCGHKTASVGQRCPVGYS